MKVLKKEKLFVNFFYKKLFILSIVVSFGDLFDMFVVMMFFIYVWYVNFFWIMFIFVVYVLFSILLS